jgi:hypothetical protein
VGPSIVSVGGKFSNFPCFVLVVASDIFVQQLNFAHIPSFPHHLQQKTITQATAIIVTHVTK